MLHRVKEHAARGRRRDPGLVRSELAGHFGRFQLQERAAPAGLWLVYDAERCDKDGAATKVLEGTEIECREYVAARTYEEEPDNV